MAVFSDETAFSEVAEAVVKEGLGSFFGMLPFDAPSAEVPRTASESSAARDALRAKAAGIGWTMNFTFAEVAGGFTR